MKRISLLMAVLSLGCMGIFPGFWAHAADPIVLGAPLPLASHYGWGAQRALILAVEGINAAGGVKVGKEKRPFKLEIMDDRDVEPGVPVSEAILVVEKLILDKKVNFIVAGPIRSEAAMAVQDVIAKHKKISINSVSLTPAYPKRVGAEYPRLKYLFHSCLDFGWVAQNVMIPFMLSLEKRFGLKRMCSVVQDAAYARATSPGFEKTMQEKGWKVTGTEVYPTGATDFSMGLLKMKREKAQVMLTWLDMPESSILMQQWHDLKIPVIPFGFNSAADQPGFWKTTSGKIQYALVNPIDAGDAPSNATPWTMKFIKAYEKRWKLEPEGHGCAPSYMVPYILKDAIERAGTIETEAMITALEKTDMMGVGGRIRFEPKTHQLIGSVKLDPQEGEVGTIFQWLNGKRVVVFPESIKMGDVVLPPFMKDNK